jgi:hypothetical protein
MAKKSPLKRAKEKAWKNFSLYIRLRDCLRTTGGIYHGRCCTCGKSYPLAQLQAGHFVPGRTNALLFREKGCHAQCAGCNIFKHGAVHEYIDFMKASYGDEIMEEERRQRYVTIKYTTQDFLQIAEKYKKKSDEILNNN